MDITFKKCETEDLEQLKSISTSTFKVAFESQNDPEDFKNYLNRAFSKKQLREELKTPETTFYFAYKDNELVGYFKVNQNKAQSEFQESEGMELERIYVIASYQGQGIGLQMLSFAESIAQQEDKTYLWLGVWEKNPKAIRFYERHGYIKFGTHPYYIETDKQTDWLLKKQFR